MDPQPVPEAHESLPIGTYRPPGPNDKRSPCPMINALANHGYLPRDGRNVLQSDMHAAMSQAGLSSVLATFFINTVYTEHQPSQNSQKFLVSQASQSSPTTTSFLSKAYSTLRDPWSLLSRLGTRPPGQTDTLSRPIISLDQLALHNAIEHDISLTRRDHAQPQGNCASQPDLVEEVLASCGDGAVFTLEQLAGVRRRRIETRRAEDAGLVYGKLQHELGCGEIALLLGVFGDGKSVKREYLETFLREEKLPREQGWQQRGWWSLGLVEVKFIANHVKSAVGLQI